MKKWVSLATRFIFLFIIVDFIWGLISLDSLPEPIKKITSVFLGPLVILSLFITLSLKLLWKLPVLGAPIRLLFASNPVLYGTWQGRLDFDYDGKKQNKNAFLVIMQPDALSIHCWLLTDERKSASEIVFFESNKGVGTLTYTYRSEEEVVDKDKNPSHMGVTVLQLDSSTKRYSFKGYYCTNRRTVGSMSFARNTKRITTTYESACRLCGISP